MTHRHALAAPPNSRDLLDRRTGPIDAELLSAIIEGSEDAIITKTMDGAITFWNGGATRLFGYCAEEMIGQPISRILPLELRNEVKEIIAKLARGERIDHFDTVRMAKDGRSVVVSLTVSPLRDATGAVFGGLKVARDISERTEIEKALRDAKEAAQRATETAERATEVAQQARMEAESAARAKTEFLAVMSHEIRTPMTSVSGFVDLLTNTGELTSQQHRYLGLIKTANAALLTIVDDILDSSRLEAGRLELERRPFSPSSLTHDLAAIFLPAAAAKNLFLEYTIDRDLPGWLMGDESRLRQVLLNLLNNAVKFTERGSITIEVRPQASADGCARIRFSVTDTGIGIPGERQHRLFKTFSQADSSVSRRHGGTGLGLAICKRLVELMDGEIGVLSNIDQGSCFWFTAKLPLASPPAPWLAAESPPPEGVGDRKARILVVDDIDANREIVQAYLWGDGYGADTAGSATEAIRMLQNERYDLVLMDIQMPVMDGVTATRCIRALPNSIKDIPIIAMTGNVLPQQVRSFLDAGMNDHVGKPIERAKLYNSVRRWVPRAEGREVVVAVN